jgi:hypothetical protein
VPRKRDTSALFDVPAGKIGRVERALNTALAAARRARSLADVDAGVIALARAQARGVDVAEAARDVWALARVSSELRETLIRLRLDPVARGAGGDQLADFLDRIGRPVAGGSDPAAGH